jgi:hypothetical protein
MPPPPPSPPRQAPAARGIFPGLFFKIAAIVALACVSVAVGAFALPRREKQPVAQDQGPPPSTVEPDNQTISRQADDLNRTAERTLRGVSVVRAISPPVTFDVPSVRPQLPADGAAYAVARLITRRINARLDASKVPASPLAGDAEFIRRAHLDIVGRIPSRQRVVAFLDDTDPLKRAKLIDELLASPDYGRRLARIWADILIKRDFDNNKNLRPGPFIAWLAERFNQNAGWDQIVREMITAKGAEGTAPETFFILAHQDNRQPSPSKLTGAVGNLFMGIQIHCAECHQHPFTAKWGMDDFWGMAAFFGHTRAQRGPGGKGKRPAGPATIVELETAPAPKNKKGARLGPAIRAGLVINVRDPNDPRKVIRTARGKFFESKQPPPSGKAPYRPHLAKWLTAAENPYFARAAVNRMWAHFFARGLVHPIEDMNPQNRPTHPVLLRELSEAFVKSKYDLKALVRAICNSEPYQRTSRPRPDNASDDRLYSHAPIKVMEARVLLDSLAVVTGQRARAVAPKGRQGARSLTGSGGDPLVRFFDTREYDDDPTEYSYGIPQLLRLMNTRLTAASAVVARKLVSDNQGNADSVLDDVYLTALSRRPSERERDRMRAYVARQNDPAQGYAGVLWALLNCAEFVSNH